MPNGWVERAAILRSAEAPSELRIHATDPMLHELVLRYPDKRFATESTPELTIVVDPVRARFSSWYEFFPRSTSEKPGAHGTFADCEKRLPYIAAMGFNVVYLPPVHPIGRSFRKGRNNNPESQPGDYRQPLGNRRKRRRTQGDSERSWDARRLQAIRRQSRRTGLVCRAGYRLSGGAGSSVRKKARELVQEAARWDHSIRRKSAKEIPGHLPL